MKYAITNEQGRYHTTTRVEQTRGRAFIFLDWVTEKELNHLDCGEKVVTYSSKASCNRYIDNNLGPRGFFNIVEWND